MRLTLTFCAVFFFSFIVSAQQFVLKKGQDTLRSRTDLLDTVTLSYELSGLKIGSQPRIQIKHDGGTAKIGVDFNLFDAYNSPTNQIEISRVENMAGNFKVQIAGNITEAKTINLQILITQEGKVTKDQVRLIVTSPVKKTEGEPNKPKSKESIEFFIHNDTKITIYEDDTTPVKVNKKHNASIDVSKSEITQKGKFEYRFRITTTDNEIYYSTLKLTREFEFQPDDKLYFRGQSGNLFIHARDIFLITRLLDSEETKTPEDNSIKFKL